MCGWTSKRSGRFQLPLQDHNDVVQAIHVDPSLAHILLELLDGVHADSLSNGHSGSCAGFQTSSGIRE